MCAYLHHGFYIHMPRINMSDKHHLKDENITCDPFVIYTLFHASSHPRGEHVTTTHISADKLQHVAHLQLIFKSKPDHHSCCLKPYTQTVR